MAFDIFSGANLKVEFSKTAGTTAATDFKDIPEVANFTTSGFESTVIDVVTYNSPYNRKLLGTMSVPNIELEVNWLPDDEIHLELEAAATSQVRGQVRISYYEDATHTAGTYVIYNVFVSSTTVSGGKDEVVKKNFTLAVDQGPVGKGLLPLVP